MKPGSDMPCGAASSVTERGPASSDCSTARRVPSASAANTASSAGPERPVGEGVLKLTIRFSILLFSGFVKGLRGLVTAE
ncbi:MAG: hypothetical protein JWN73_3312 [Betaproteobacteria bacterium]|nr:hypothetical protein [Betaproteobacteria bacterium]